MARAAPSLESVIREIRAAGNGFDRVQSGFRIAPDFQPSGHRFRWSDVTSRSGHSLELVMLAAVAVPLLPVLHLCNRLSTRRTMACIARLAPLMWLPVRLQPHDVGRTVNGVARLLHMQGTTCLARSQLIWLLLSIGGFAPVVRVGAGSGLGDGTLAHAWVELDGVPIADAVDVATLHPPFDRPLLGSAG